MNESATFDEAFRRRAPAFRLRAEEASDRDFLVALACACSPLAEAFPPLLLAQQAELQLGAHRAAHPAAMWRIVEDASGPCGRIVIDWHTGSVAHGVDIAVMPGKREGAPGLQMLRCWTETADNFGLPCRLEVVHDNPARRIYERLGFAQVGDPAVPVLTMVRHPMATS